MTDHKFTDDEIIKAAECCFLEKRCEGCPLDRGVGDASCIKDLHSAVLDLFNRQKAEIEKLEKLDELAERSIEASTAVINDLRSEVALLNDANTNLQDLYQAEKSKVLKKQEKLIMAYRKLQTAKSEAIKEFAENLTQDFKNHRLEMNLNGLKGTHRTDEMTYETIIEYIDNLVKEMTEGKV